MKAASEKTTNSTSRTIVNCHSRRSMPRRLRYTAESPPNVPDRPDTAGLQKDRDDERDADDDLADGQKWVHGVQAPRSRRRMLARLAQPQDQRPAGHLRPPRQAGELEQRRCDVGEDAIARAEARATRPTRTSGTGLSEWAVTGRPSASRIRRRCRDRL